MPLGKRSRGRELVVFSFRLFTDIHRGRVGEKEHDGYYRDSDSRQQPKDHEQKEEEKRCYDSAARVGLDHLDLVGEVLFEFVY